MIIPTTKEDLDAYNYTVLPFVVVSVISLILFAFFNVIVGFYILLLKLKIENNNRLLTEIRYTGNVCTCEPKKETQPKKTKGDEFIKPISVIEVDIIAKKGIHQLKLQISTLLGILNHASYLLTTFMALLFLFMFVHMVTNLIFGIDNSYAQFLSLNDDTYDENDTYNDIDNTTSSHKSWAIALRFEWLDLVSVSILIVPVVLTVFVLFGGIRKFRIWAQTILLMLILLFEIASVVMIILAGYCTIINSMETIYLASKSFRIIISVYAISMYILLNACRVVKIELFYVTRLFANIRVNYKRI